jgi:hypothetical protein
MKTLRAVLVAAIALTAAALSVPALASATHGLKKVHDPGRVTGAIHGHCYYRDHGQLPDPRCTPGSIDPAITPAKIRSTICRKGWTRTVRPPETATEKFKYDVAYPAYGLGRPKTELDHLVPLELGGSNDATNLWPEYPPTPNPKDKVERALNIAVCDGKVSLARAQAVIAYDWMTAEKRLGLSVAPPPSPKTTAPAAASTTSSGCYPLTNGGNCYEPGEYCRNSDHGVSGVAGDGERIICEDNNGWRWEPA